KADVERGEAAPRGVAPPAFDELVPEARRGPVLDRPRRGGRGRIVLVAVKPDQLVAEAQRLGRCETALAELVEAEAELPRHADEELEMRGAKMERAAFDRAFRAAEHVRVRDVGGRWGRAAAGAARGPCLPAKADADFVRENLFRRAQLIERAGIQHLQKL